ncbi:MAG: helix-turn-helix domain-containing protein [Planctomycetota bacterium]
MEVSHDRYVIHHLNLVGLSRAEIGRRIGRSRGTISRELQAAPPSPWEGPPG